MNLTANLKKHAGIDPGDPKKLTTKNNSSKQDVFLATEENPCH